MKTILRDLQVALIERAREMLIHDSDFVDTVIEAYNRYQDNERDGVDYLFCARCEEDVKCCFEGGLKVKEFVMAYNKMEKNGWTAYFHFGQNHPVPSFYISEETLVANLNAYMKPVIQCMLLYPDIDAYSKLYKALITDYMFNNEMV